MHPFMHFLHKYVVLLVGVREMNAYFRANPGQTILDRLTASDVAYTILLYESTVDVWEEDATIMDRNPKGSRLHTLREANRTAKLKYHVAKGTRIPFGVDGWKPEGRTHYRMIKEEITKIVQNDALYEFLETCWEKYAEENIVGDRKNDDDGLDVFDKRLREEETEEIEIPDDNDMKYGLKACV